MAGEITITDLTTATVDGEGAFDHMMRAVITHLQVEFEKNRIRGPEYSQVYLSALQTTMDQAIRYLLERGNAELIQKQIELAEKKLLQADKDLLKADKELELADKQIEQANKGLAKTDKEIQLLQGQYHKVMAEREMINLEAANIPKKGNLIDQQVLQLKAEILNIPKQGLVLEAQECKLKGEYNYTLSQIDRNEHEIQLIAAKTLSERAQTQDGIADPNSSIGLSNQILRGQYQGYLRLAEQQASKIMTDLFAVYMSVDDSASFEDIKDNFLTSMNSILSELKDGVVT